MFMATQKPLSTISYNTESFLSEKLKSLYKAHIIQSYQYIKHKGEDGDKDHIHLRLEPNKRLDPMDLAEMFIELDPNNVKPLCCRPFRPSKEEDWLLYAVHDKDYLKLKYKGGEKGEKIPYKWTDIIANEYYDTEIAYIRARSYLEHTTTNMATRLKDGESAFNLVMQGENVHTVNALVKALSMTDYERITSENIMLKKSIDNIISEMKTFGYTIELRGDGEISIT